MKNLIKLIVSMLILSSCIGDKSNSVDEAVEAGVAVSFIFGGKDLRVDKEVIETYKNLKDEIDISFTDLPKEGVGLYKGMIKVKDSAYLELVAYLIAVGGSPRESLVNARVEIENSNKQSKAGKHSFIMKVTKSESAYVIKRVEVKDLLKK